VTREQFIDQLESVFTVSDAWRAFFEIDDEAVTIATGDPDSPFRLEFATVAASAPRTWTAAAERPPAARPLDGVHVAIDAGHLGGRWAKMEERWFRIGAAEPVTEGDMTLKVAKLLRPRLEALGARVSLVRDSTEPLTSFRPQTLMTTAREIRPESPQALAELLFYRTAEIRARADKVNHTLQPDLVLCLHFNAEAWGDPSSPTLVPRHHFHLLVNGAYTDDELALADQRHEIVRKIATGIHHEEAALAHAMAESFATLTGLPPYRYEPDSGRARMIDDNPYVWARNLLANRLYHCPVVFLEPYVMNSTLDYPRLQAGDYEGLREIDGQAVPSIFREYADAVTAGLAAHYQRHRTQP
jgi:N-acetylmuramoyl-L-alanine amidase